jgi:hypothetical protein
MAFNKDPVFVGLLIEQAQSGKDYEVIAEGEREAHWVIRRVGGNGKGMERAEVDINDPFKWTRFNLDELPAERRAETIAGKAAAEADAPAGADEDGDDDADQGDDGERTIEAGFLRPGLEYFDGDQWVTVTKYKGEQAGWITVATSAGDRRVSFFSRPRVKGAPTG